MVMTTTEAQTMLECAYRGLNVSQAARHQAAHHLAQFAAQPAQAEIADELLAVAEVLADPAPLPWDWKFQTTGPVTPKRPEPTDPLAPTSDAFRLVRRIIGQVAS